MTTIRADIVRQQIAQLLLKYPSLADDPEALEMSLESETEAKELLEHILARETETANLIAGLDIHIAEMRARSNRLSDRQSAERELMLSIMHAAGVQKLELPTATLSTRKGSVCVVIEDESAVPDRFCDIVRKVSKAPIKAAIEAGEQLNYASLQEGSPSLAIRRK